MWLNSLVLSDGDDKPQVPFHNPALFITLWEVTEHTHYAQGVGHRVPDAVVCSL